MVENCPTDDLALLRRYYREQDGSSFQIFVQRHAGTAYRLALGYLHNAADAEDAVQASFLDFIRNGERVCNSDHSNLRGWLMAIVVGNCRKKLRDLRYSASLAQRLDRQADAEAKLPALEYDELVAASLRSVNALPEHYRVPLLLHYMEGYSYREVAEALSARESAVRKQVSRGIGLLREALAAAGFAIEDAAIPAIIVGAPRAENVELCARILAAAKNSSSGTKNSPEVASNRIRVFTATENPSRSLRRTLVAAILLIGGASSIVALNTISTSNRDRGVQSSGPGVAVSTPALMRPEGPKRPPELPKAGASAASDNAAVLHADRPGTSANEKAAQAQAREVAAFNPPVSDIEPRRATIEFTDLQQWDSMSPREKKMLDEYGKTQLRPTVYEPFKASYTTTVKAENAVVAALRAWMPDLKTGNFDYEFSDHDGGRTVRVWLQNDAHSPNHPENWYCPARVREYVLEFGADGAVAGASCLHDWIASGPPKRNHYSFVKKAAKIESNVSTEHSDIGIKEVNEGELCDRSDAKSNPLCAEQIARAAAEFDDSHAPLDYDVLATTGKTALSMDEAKQMAAAFTALRYMVYHQALSKEEMTAEERDKSTKEFFQSLLDEMNKDRRFRREHGVEEKKTSELPPNEQGF